MTKESLDSLDSDYIKWNSRFEIGIPIIDNQHKTLVLLCSRLYKELIQKKIDKSLLWNDSFKAALRECFEYTQTHFRDEEKLMRACDYPGFAEHKMQHNSFIKKILDTTKGFEYATIGTAFKFVNFLYDWILTHIAYEDRLFVDCILDYYRRIKGV